MFDPSWAPICKHFSGQLGVCSFFQVACRQNVYRWKRILELQLCDHETFNRADREGRSMIILLILLQGDQEKYCRFPAVYNGVCTWWLSVKKLSRIRSFWLAHNNSTWMQLQDGLKLLFALPLLLKACEEFIWNFILYKMYCT